MYKFNPLHSRSLEIIRNLRGEKSTLWLFLSAFTRRICFISIGVFLLVPTFASAQQFKDTFPKIGAHEIGAWKESLDPNYRQVLARHDFVILGMWRNWGANDTVTGKRMELRDVVVDIKRRAAEMGNNNIMVGKYTIFMEASSKADSNASADKWEKLHSETGPGYQTKNDWWARDRHGNHESSWPGSWATNVTSHVKRDSNGDTWPEWVANRDFEWFFRRVPELDMWYIDNWFYRPRVTVDWDGDGVNDDPKSAKVAREFREGQMRGLRRIRELAPNMIVMGNAGGGDPYKGTGMMTDPEYSGQLTTMFQAAIGKSYSTENWGSWEAMMVQYQTTLANSKHRFSLMTANGKADDYATMRYGLASCLLDDGYYYYTTNEAENKSGLWFDEYDVKLGRAIDPPQFNPWKKGIYRRRFENGMVLVNPKANGRQTVQVEAGYKRISGTQDPTTNNGQPASSITLNERDGIILLAAGAGNKVMRPKAPVMN